MQTPFGKLKTLSSLLCLCFLFLFNNALYARRNEILCEIKFSGTSGVEKNAGVWIDGLYMGYLNELRGSKKILLPPGEHTLLFRQNGYQDLNTRIVLGPGQKEHLWITMEPDLRAQYPAETAEIKLKVLPKRAAVFVDGSYVGHVSEFDGMGEKMLVSPGKHTIRITLPGWEPFETEVSLLPYQRFVLKTELFTGDIREAQAPIKEKEQTAQAQVPR